MKQLIAAGANVNVISSEGNSPLLEAAMDGSTAVQVCVGVVRVRVFCVCSVVPRVSCCLIMLRS